MIVKLLLCRIFDSIVHEVWYFGQLLDRYWKKLGQNFSSQQFEGVRKVEKIEKVSKLTLEWIPDPTSHEDKSQHRIYGRNSTDLILIHSCVWYFWALTLQRLRRRNLCKYQLHPHPPPALLESVKYCITNESVNMWKRNENYQNNERRIDTTIKTTKRELRQLSKNQRKENWDNCQDTFKSSDSWTPLVYPVRV